MFGYERRLPIYLLLDCSESMAGDAIEEVSRGVETMVTALKGDPLALETAWLSVITFSRYAKQIAPLLEIGQFQTPKLSVRTGTALGAALDVLYKCIEKDVTKTTPTTKGDYKPLVFLFTDGQPTDEWEPAADRIKQHRKPSIANIYAIGCGPDVDADVLKRVTDVVLQMKDTSAEGWRKTFIWLTASVQSTTKALDGGKEGQPVDLPALPETLEFAPEQSGPKDLRPRQVFLHALCSRTRKPYLMRFARRGQSERYVSLCSHPLEVFEDDGGEYLPAIHTSMLDGCPSCPYCENPGAGMCECGVLFCAAGAREQVVTCPKCSRQLTLCAGGEGGAGFDVQQSQG